MKSGAEKWPSNRTSLRNARLKGVLIASFLPLMLLVLWDLSVRLHFVPNTILATPLQTLNSFVTLSANGVLLKHIIVSGMRMVLGLAISADPLKAFRSHRFLAGALGRNSRPETPYCLAPIPGIASSAQGDAGSCRNKDSWLPANDAFAKSSNQAVHWALRQLASQKPSILVIQASSYDPSCSFFHRSSGDQTLRLPPLPRRPFHASQS